MPDLEGAPIAVSYRADVRVHRGRLVDAGGHEMHAATWIRSRRMVFDSALRRNRGEWRRIVVHELFHFAWARLGNSARRSWHQLLSRELAGKARGELGWSAEWRKEKLSPAAFALAGRKARDYACEAFCDTAAWLYAGLEHHDEFTLSARWRKPRRLWFIQHFGDRAVPL